MYCPYCGHGNEPNHRYCANCGADLTAGGSVPPDEETEPAYEPAYEEPSYRESGFRREKGKSIALIAAIAVAAVLLVVLVIVLLSGGRNGKSHAQPANGGTANNPSAAVTPAPTAKSTGTSSTATPSPTPTATPSPTPTATPTPSPTPTPQARYLLPDSNSRYLTENDLASLTHRELCLARNEIFARHGRKFSNREIAKYFSEQSWYSGTIEPANFSSGVFNAYEKSNVTFILEYETEHYGGSYY